MTIGKVAEIFHISTYSIRFYEQEGLLAVPRNSRGVREFDEDSIAVLKAILHYRNVGMSLTDIKKIFSNFDNHQLSIQLLKETKTELDHHIAELEKTREYLINKIALHESIEMKNNKES